MNVFDGLDLEGRTEVANKLLGRVLTMREFVDLANRDRRNVTELMLSMPGMKRWIDAGSPDALPPLQFCGSDSSRVVFDDVLRRVPAAVAWDTAEHVVVVEVGRGAYGWQSRLPVGRDRIIALDGKLDDERLADVAAHEIGHSFGAPTSTIPNTVVTMARSEYTSRLVSSGVTHDELERIENASEKQADDLAELFGFKRHHARSTR